MVIWSSVQYGHLVKMVIWSSGRLVNVVFWSSGNLIIWSTGHLVNTVIWSMWSSFLVELFIFTAVKGLLYI